MLAAPQLEPSSMAVLVEEMEVEGGVELGGGGRGLREEDPALLKEFTEDKGVGTDGGADEHGAVVLLNGKVSATYLELYHWHVRDPHLSLSKICHCSN